MYVRLTPEGVLKDLGIPYEERVNRLVVHCPFHHDTRPSSGVYLDTRLFHCYACSITLDLLTFYARVKEISREAAEKELGGGGDRKDTYDRFLLARTRIFYEGVLGEFREALPEDMRNHARLGELLDKILQKYERGRINLQEMDLVLSKWYNKVRTERNRARAEPGTASRTSSDVRVEKGLADLPGLGRSDSKPIVVKVETPTSDEVVTKPITS